jgi:PAS domain S-box-containing protein
LQKKHNCRPEIYPLFFNSGMDRTTFSSLRRFFPVKPETQVLMVDDEPGILEIAGEFLEIEGDIRVTTAGSASEALDILHSREIDVIVSDYLMPPGMNSIELLKKLRDQGNDTPFIIFTGRGREEVAIEALNNGAAFYLQKGINIEVQFTELRNMIDQVTGRRRVERALKESEEQNRMIVENAPVIIYTARYNGEELPLTSHNPAFERMTGWSCRELSGRSLRSLIHPGDIPLLREMVHTGPGAGAPHNGELRIRTKRGEYFTGAFVTTPLMSSGRVTGELGIVRDITEERRNIILLKNKGDELLEKNKELESFCYSVSHDLRAPLRIIEGYTEIINRQSGNSLPPESRQAIERIKVAGKRMDRIIDDLLRLSRAGRTALVVGDVNLSSLVTTILNNLSGQQPGRKKVFLVAEGLVARCDRNLMQGALENMLDNAWKYTRNNDETRITFGSLQKDRDTWYFIRDNGVGFDAKNAENLFMPFSRFHTESEFPGNGIGLATVKRIIQRHGGRIAIESDCGKGTTVLFTVPGPIKGSPVEPD